MYYSTEGVVLKKIATGEADEFCILYTKDFGKISFLTKGIKKESAKLKGHLELGSLSAVNFVLGRRGGQLVQAKLLNFWPLLREDWGRLTAAGRLLEAVHKSCEEGEKDESIWRLLLDSLRFLDRRDLANFHPALFEKDFFKKMSICLGYGGRLDVFKSR